MLTEHLTLEKQTDADLWTFINMQKYIKENIWNTTQTVQQRNFKIFKHKFTCVEE